MLHMGFNFRKSSVYSTLMQVKQIDAKDTYRVRSTMLRPGLELTHCHFDGDFDDLTFHLGAYDSDVLASVASFYLRSHKDFKEEYQYQLRGMATLKDYQHRGYSRSLLKTAFPLIKANHVNLLWCNAREEAVDFYKKAGFEIKSDIFQIPDIGAHYLMAINL